MKCVICHSEDIGIKPVYEEVCHGDDIIRIPLRILVCASCGERYYDRPAMRRLEAVRDKIKHDKISLTQVGKVLICED